MGVLSRSVQCLYYSEGEIVGSSWRDVRSTVDGDNLTGNCFFNRKVN